MQDRFKFRFWHKPTQKMLACYGFNEHYTFADTLDGIGMEYNPCSTKDCILMQCTGLKDKNGKLIYEGDIVKFSSIYGHAIFEIKWSDELSTFGYEDDETDFSELGRLYQEAAYVEIIGNIYENPELLEDSNANIHS